MKTWWFVPTYLYYYVWINEWQKSKANTIVSDITFIYLPNRNYNNNIRQIQAYSTHNIPSPNKRLQNTLSSSTNKCWMYTPICKDFLGNLFALFFVRNPNRCWRGRAEAINKKTSNTNWYAKLVQVWWSMLIDDINSKYLRIIHSLQSDQENFRLLTIFHYENGWYQSIASILFNNTFCLTNWD